MRTVFAAARAGGALALLVLAAAPVAAQDGSAVQDGQQLFQARCAACHKLTAAEIEPGSKAPALADIRGRQMAPETVLRATDAGGVMVLQAQGLSVPERQRIAEWMTGKTLAAATAVATMQGRCRNPAPPINHPLKGAHWDGWGVDGDNGRFQPTSKAGLKAADVSKLKLKWAFGFPGATNAFAQPTVASGRVFVGSDTGAVYALDAKTGCYYWVFHAPAAVRTAVVIGASSRVRSGALAYVSDVRANVYALDARSGELVWAQKADEHRVGRITASPVLVNGILYVPVSGVGEEGSVSNPTYECCTFRGSIMAFHAGTGRPEWKAWAITDEPRQTGTRPNGVRTFGPAGASIWNTPTVDLARGVVYAGTGNAFTTPVGDTTDAVLAFSLKDGRIVWKHQLTAGDVNGGGAAYVDFDIGSSPILRKLPDGRSLVLVGQKSGDVYALDPDKGGALVWKVNLSKGGFWGGIEWGMAADDRHVYVPISDYPFRPPRWPPTPEAGSLIALRLDTGQQVWAQKGVLTCEGEKCHPGRTAAVTAIGDAVFTGSMDGYLRAYATTDGRLLWETNTAREYTTVNGVTTRGGSLNGPGPAVAGGMVFANSGYSYQGMGGNALLAFAPE